MRGWHLAVAVLLLASCAFGSGSPSFVVPTTTLAAQTGNNTSAASSFSAQSNGNRGAGNISKLDMHTLLYPGATTKVYAHLLMWFGGTSHMNVGYNSSDTEQVKSQIDDMVSRGIDGVIIDWYGQNNSIDQAAKLVMAQAEAHPGFTFAIMIDQGAIRWYSCAGCSPQQALINDLQYLEQNYFSSPAYMTIQGQPVVTNFNVDLSYSVDWKAANDAMATHPAFWFQNNNGFTHVLSGGSYSWVMPATTDYGMSYLENFYGAGEGFAAEQTVGAAYKGFNDSLAAWGSNRVMGQQCGQTWLQTFSRLNGIYNSSHPLAALQLITWNDYEEATQIESGIDNCLSVSSSVTSGNLQWKVSGNENTVDHYAVFISDDGQNLMPMTDVAAGTHALNLCQFSVPSGTYQMFVQAVGKPGLANQMSAATSFASSCAAAAVPAPPSPSPSPAPLPALGFTASPASVSIQAGLSQHLTITASSGASAYNAPISLSCGALPSNLSCTFSPPTITPGGGIAKSTLTISTGTLSARGSGSLPFSAGWMIPFGLVGFVFAGKRKHARYLQLLVLCAILGLGMGATSCGSGKSVTQNAVPSVAAPGSYSVTVNGNSSAVHLSATVDIVVQ